MAEVLSASRVYLPVRTFKGGESVPERTVWTIELPNIQAPILLKRDGGFMADLALLFDIEERIEDFDLAILTPLVCHEKQGFVDSLLAWGFEQVTAPIDDPFCGKCRRMTSIRWEYEDVAGDGPPIWGAEGVSRCCRAALLADPCGIVDFTPDPDEYGAFEPSEPDEVNDL